MNADEQEFAVRVTPQELSGSHIGMMARADRITPEGVHVTAEGYVNDISVESEIRPAGYATPETRVWDAYVSIGAERHPLADTLFEMRAIVLSKDPQGCVVNRG